MQRSRKSQPEKAAMTVFARACREVLAPWLERFGFTQGERQIDRWSARCCFVNGRRYVRVTASADPRDAPAFCNVLLGEGDLSWPEVDWNGVPLWQLARAQGASDASEYPLDPSGQIPALVERMRLDLERYALDFLQGEVAVFTAVRARVNRARNPYTIHVPNGDGTYRTEIDPVSAALKSRFS
jgi:hypothetical protein